MGQPFGRLGADSTQQGSPHSGQTGGALRNRARKRRRMLIVSLWCRDSVSGSGGSFSTPREWQGKPPVPALVYKRAVGTVVFTSAGTKRPGRGREPMLLIRINDLAWVVPVVPGTGN